jgi:hypothetical protein
MRRNNRGEDASADAKVAGSMTAHHVYPRGKKEERATTGVCVNFNIYDYEQA